MPEQRAVLRVAADMWRAELSGRPGLRRRQEERLTSLVAHARLRSGYFREHDADLPPGPVPLKDLPATHKPSLMARFDEWTTDPRINLDDVKAFMDEPALSGVPFLDEYFVCRSSGTTGHPGIFVADAGAIAATFACYAVMGYRLLRRAPWRRVIAERLRQARVVGPGGHFAGAGMVALGQRDSQRKRRQDLVVSVEQPLGDVVAQLNSFDPAILQGYPSAIRQLAREQDAGRLQIRPGLVGTGGETVSMEERSQMAAIFGAPVVDGYASSECLLLAATCGSEWLHYRSDWMILEPVDAEHGPVAPGESSDTVLLTDLANHVQPIIRYDLGDSVRVRPEPCDCGSPLPAFRVVGRQDDVLRFTSAGRVVEVLPLAITATTDGVEGLERLQLVQTGPTHLSVRITCEDPGQRDTAWRQASGALRVFLGRMGLETVVIELDDQPPDPLGASGKLRQVIGLADTGLR